MYIYIYYIKYKIKKSFAKFCKVFFKCIKFIKHKDIMKTSRKVYFLYFSLKELLKIIAIKNLVNFTKLSFKIKLN